MQEDRIYKEDVIEINLLDLFWSVLRKWKSILTAMVVLGVLLAGFGAIKEYIHLKDEDFVTEQQETYESDLETYELEKKLLERKIENLEEDLARQEFYEKNAIMLFFDEYNVYVQTVSYYINTGYEIAPELFYQNPNYTSVITNSYRAAVDRIKLDEIVSTVSEPDLTTVNPINGSKRMLTTSVDAGNGVLNITIYGDTEERVDQIYSVVKEIVSEQKPLLDQVIGEHTLDVLSEKRYVDVDPDFGSLQDSFNSKTETITQGILKSKEDLEELEEPVDGTPSGGSIIKKAIIYGIIGLLIGLVLLGVIALIKLILEDKVNSVEDIRRRYTAPVLGTYKQEQKKQTKLDQLIARKLGIPASKTAEEQFQFIASSIHLFLQENKRILVLGNSDIETMNFIKEQLDSLIPEVEINVGGNVNDSPKAIHSLSEETAVVCVETWGKTSHKEMRHELDVISASGNTNLGYIVVS